MAQCPTCCVQPARREQPEDGADSGDADEDEGAEGTGGLLCLGWLDVEKFPTSCCG